MPKTFSRYLLAPALALATSLGTPALVHAQSILDQYYHGNRDSMQTAALGLVMMPGSTVKADKLNPEIEAMEHDQPFKAEERQFVAADGRKLQAYLYPAKSASTMILFLHGVGTKARPYNRMAGMLRTATKAEVWTLDLRGHGNSEGRPGDVDHMNQYAEDVAGILGALKKQFPKKRLILAGHSMGCGVALRTAMLKKAPVDGYIFLAPLIGHDSPALPTAEESQKLPAQDQVAIHFPRIIGLKMLDELGQHQYDSLPVLWFAGPPTVGPRAYSYRANMSMAPDSYQMGLKALNAPMLMLVGTNDEAFNAVRLKDAVSSTPNTKAVLIPGATHNDIRQNPEAFKAISAWMQTLK